jgi:diguanylate cyclase (GGDEF)-like protein
MQESLHREFARAQRHESPVSLIMFDVDHFKNFNDEHGHEAGDLVLKELAALLQRSTRGEDIACRYGGEEFLIIMPGATTELAEKRAEELRSTVQRALTIRHSGKRLGVTVSLGVATYPDHAEDVDQALLKVDEAMYAAKQAGRNTVKVSS